ncbi:glutathione S-transferase [Sarotherodon galilaeus]
MQNKEENAVITTADNRRVDRPAETRKLNWSRYTPWYRISSSPYSTFTLQPWLPTSWARRRISSPVRCLPPRRRNGASDTSFPSLGLRCAHHVFLEAQESPPSRLQLPRRCPSPLGALVSPSIHPLPPRHRLQLHHLRLRCRHQLNHQLNRLWLPCHRLVQLHLRQRSARPHILLGHWTCFAWAAAAFQDSFYRPPEQCLVLDSCSLVLNSCSFCFFKKS